MRRFLTLALLVSVTPDAVLARVMPGNSVLVLSNVVQDAVPSPSPTPDVELEEKKRARELAEEETKRLVAEQEAAEARRAKLKAETDPFGDSTKVTVPTGSVTTDEGGFIEVEMLSHEAARQISYQVMTSLCAQRFPVRIKDQKGLEFPNPAWKPTFDNTKKIETLIIYDANEVAALEMYSSMFKQLQNFQREFTEKHEQAETLLLVTNLKAAPPTGPDFGPAALIAAPGVATGLIKSVAELINLFRTDTQFKNKKVTIPEDMVVSYLIKNINTDCSSKPVIYYPHFYPPNLVSDATDSELLKLLKAIGESKGEAAKDIKEITKRIEDINTLVAKLKLVKETPTEIAKKEEAKKKCKDKKCIEDLNKEIEALKDAVTAANEKIDDLTGNNRQYFVQNILPMKIHEEWLAKLTRLKSLTQLLIDSADQVTTKLNTPDDATKLTAMAQLLRAERLKEILKEPFAFTLRIAVTANGTTKIKKNLFVDAKVRHTAGANLIYQLFDHNGRVVMGDATQFYFDYMSSSDVKGHVCETNKNCPPRNK